ncbi:hydroxymethylpyrimidine/phosphomethylpyrimidine kinase [Enterococcus saigonensis]|uniref:Hydroxymethylpyrimidine/phosphomethylpyrimidine kinase n=1 Tax=Enterococcus saigonensis TaxID=1805431 RepID=A0A679IC27_9ENTE|nr:bifunctional hydroxymethylpyrimidine kinase/phosphomethylpyrimidine kinase [Enterococcus saigonensis]BCA85793.1 hydroxymethylpyrimidine/phosphomethylpyrimidine kinase [Enterococcus saigonensis]
MEQYPQALTIAGSDSDGSAGMQADLHTFFARKVYGASVLTACVAGNSYGIGASVTLPTEFIDKQFELLAADYQIRASKTGMLANSELIQAIVRNYRQYDFGPLVVDPVIMTKHGNMLIEEDALATLKKELIPLAFVLTPNFYEAEKLTDMKLDTAKDFEIAARILQKMGAKNIVIKGAHQDGKQTKVVDYLLLETGESHWLEAPYHKTERINGTGDSLSACITAELAKGQEVLIAVKTAKEFVNKAIAAELVIGHKFGPINHWAGNDF